VLRALRGMRSNYFIDHVDTEWCLRARAAGYRLLVVPEARLHHRLGESVKRLPILGGRKIFYHAPLRDYYMFRNTLLMLRDVPMPVTWRVHLVIRLLQFAGYFLMLGDQRRQRMAHMWLGIRHGLRRVSGRLDTATRLCDSVGVTDLDPVA
jgi:rhamnosyltransferase